MTVVNYFYNATTKKYIALFGTRFNKITIERTNVDTKDTIQKMIVPISYGPYQKFIARLQQDPRLDRKTAITLPRMAFELTNMEYDGSRKVNSVKRISSQVHGDQRKSFQYVGAPYNLYFTLSIMAKYAEDGTQILEQILPFFKPEWTHTVKLIDNLDPLDIPLVLTSVNMEDVYESDFETRRTLLWTLTFTMKGWYFGPQRDSSVIKFIDVRSHTNIASNATPDSQFTIQPGLTANGTPTNSIDETIEYELININDNWDIITIFRDEIEEPQ